MGPATKISMQCAAGLGLALMLAACGPAETPPQAPAGAPAPPETAAPPPAPATDIGADVFQAQCATCHGAEGRGPSMETLRALSPEQLRAGIRNHPPAGDIVGRLPANELADLVEYLDQ